jgi:hypothetical protein
MPDLKTHCEISLKRTGKEFRELHEWMDEPRKELGRAHRTERHDNTYIDYVEERWGWEGVLEFLHHIAVDYRDTREKMQKNYENRGVICLICELPVYNTGLAMCNECVKLNWDMETPEILRALKKGR